MTKLSATATKPNAQDKAERTAHAAASIMNEERRASDAKVARLKALRMAKEAEAPALPEATKKPTPPRPAKQARAATIRKLALQPDNPTVVRKKS